MKRLVLLALAFALSLQMPAHCANKTAPSSNHGSTRGCASCVGAYQATSSLSWTIGVAGFAVFATVTILIMLNASKSPTASTGN